MPAGELFINGQDAFIAWGISMNNTALSALMTPPPMKTYVDNDNRLEHGKKVITSNAKVASRDLTLTFNITAKNSTIFLRNYANFCNTLKSGYMEISTSYQSGVVYKCIYQSCTQFAEYHREMGSFVLKLTEPNPADRTQSINSVSENGNG